VKGEAGRERHKGKGKSVGLELDLDLPRSLSLSLSLPASLFPLHSFLSLVQVPGSRFRLSGRSRVHVWSSFRLIRRIAASPSSTSSQAA